MQELPVFPLLLGGIAVLALKLILTPKRTPLPLPPGPKPKPIIGNYYDLPPAGTHEWHHWGKHKALYGPISSISVLGTIMIILNDPRVATDLLEKRSLIYSDRPRLVLAGEMCGWEHQNACQMYGNHFKAYRKNMHAVIGSKASVTKFNDLQVAEVRRFVFRVLENPKSFIQHIRTYVIPVVPFHPAIHCFTS